MYFYLYNLQGDVVAIVDADGVVVAEYVYDAWGNVLSATGVMAEVNPLRYRGYYYDEEIGYYYLQSRYYNPEWGRFINADGTFVAGENLLAGTNLYTYCYDNPVMYVDRNGREPIFGFVMDFLDLFDLTWVGPIVVAFYDFFTNLDLSPLLVFFQIGGRFWNGLVGLFQSFDFGGLFASVWKLVVGVLMIIVGIIVWIVNAIISIFNLPFGKDTTITRKMEKEADKAMQMACWNFLLGNDKDGNASSKYTKFTQEYWMDVNRTETEKEQILNALLSEAQKILNTAANTDINFNNTDFVSRNWGRFTLSTRRISIVG